MHIRSDVELANLTDVGCERAENEDYYCYLEPENDEQFKRKGRLLAVADGMGGHTGGQIASGLAVEALRDVFLHEDITDPHQLLVEGFSRGQQAILTHAEAHPELNGMGTTCTAAIVRSDGLTYGHIGDSRLYLLRDGTLTQLTDDDSLVNQLVKNGVITPEQAMHHEKRNVLTAALGMRAQEVSAAFSEQPIPLFEDDTLVLASDGLHGMVTAEEIERVVAAQTPYEACRTLVDLAKQRGGPDNITVQVLHLRPEHS